MMTTRSLDYSSFASPSQVAMTAYLAPPRTPRRDPQQSKEAPTDAGDGGSRDNKVVAEATRLLSLLMEFAELERRRNEKERS